MTRKPTLSRNTKTIYRAFVEPDFDYGHNATPSRALAAGYAGFSFHAGVLAGGVAGVVVYQVAVHRRGRR